MITYERYIPGEVKTYYHPTRYRYVTAVVWNLGAKPIVVRPHDYDAQMRPEPLPQDETPIADLLAAVLRKESPLTVMQLIERTGKSEGGINTALRASGRFEKVGKVRVAGARGATMANAWAMRADVEPAMEPRRQMTHKGKPITAERIAEFLATAPEPMRTRDIAAAIGKSPGTVSSALISDERFRYVRVGIAEGKAGSTALWSLADEQGNSGHD